MDRELRATTLAQRRPLSRCPPAPPHQEVSDFQLFEDVGQLGLFYPGLMRPPPKSDWVDLCTALWQTEYLKHQQVKAVITPNDPCNAIDDLHYHPTTHILRALESKYPYSIVLNGSGYKREYMVHLRALLLQGSDHIVSPPVRDGRQLGRGTLLEDICFNLKRQRALTQQPGCRCSGDFNDPELCHRCKKIKVVVTKKTDGDKILDILEGGRDQVDLWRAGREESPCDSRPAVLYYFIDEYQAMPKEELELLHSLSTGRSSYFRFVISSGGQSGPVTPLRRIAIPPSEAVFSELHYNANQSQRRTAALSRPRILNFVVNVQSVRPADYPNSQDGAL